MKLHELIKSNNWLSVEQTLLQLYADQEKMVDIYRNIFEKLKLTVPVDYEELEIVLTTYECDPLFESDNDTYVDVSGRKKIAEPNTIIDSYAIEFLEWDKWLGMDLALETITNFSELEVIAHCLFEMTFVDYDEEAIQKQFESLSERVQDYKKLTDEEKKQKTISLDEIKKRLDEKKGNSYTE